MLKIMLKIMLNHVKSVFLGAIYGMWMHVVEMIPMMFEEDFFKSPVVFCLQRCQEKSSDPLVRPVMS